MSDQEKPFSEMTEEEKAEAKRKAVEEAKRKAAEKKAEKEAEAAEPKTPASADDKAKAAAAAKAKAAAAAKAKAAAAAKAKASGGAGVSDDEKAKAIAAAKAKAAAAAKAKAAKSAGGAGDDEKAKAIAAAKAKAAAAVKAKSAAGGAGAKPAEPAEETPSPNQPLLDKYVKTIKGNLGEDVLEDSYINRLAKDVPTLVAKRESFYKLAEFLKHNEQFSFEYVSELHGTDFETHMEVYAHLYSYKNNQPVAVKVKLDRDHPEVASVTPIWPGANWPEREAYDLLGIRFTGHPNLTRILMPDDWVGYPMRKDYEPYDVEV
ncbi:NADH-quinone oxidoreductase subunit C [Pseudalkalibacillus salsuginis]|uniref:NADH-quinone oxidoreductase subunit C n=1 Tax=Pseudalkalibacillus salsuginis TaxID=2910972 RepID=UPI002AFFC986|nr:NADH-quinone oxidoreductase subunit C [Pseudalkalibacillus salsuginis]